MTKRVGIIGVGRVIGVAQNHYNAIKEVPEWELGAIYDISEQNSANWIARNSLDSSLICNSMEHLFGRVDAVTICTDNNSHGSIARTVAARKLPMICEKPLSVTYVDAKQLTDDIEQAGVINYMGMQSRYHPYAQVIKEIIRSGELGEIHFCTCTLGGSRIGNASVGLEWRMQLDKSGPGAITDFGVHQVDLIHYFLGEECGEIDRVQAELGTFIKTRRSLDGSGVGEVTNDDIAVMAARMQNGAILTMNSYRILPGESFAFQIVGSKAAVWMDRKYNVYLTRKTVQGDWMSSSELVPAEPRHKFVGLARGKQYQEFHDIIEHRIPYELDFQYGAYSVGIIDAIVLAAKEGRQVRVSEIVS
jgi:predicted dehydrogenase